MKLDELKERVEQLVHGWEELREEVEHIKRERDEAICLLRRIRKHSGIADCETPGSEWFDADLWDAERDSRDFLDRIEGGQDENAI